MAPLKADDQIAKETALEAYRDAARPYGFKNRPGPGRPGYGVVSATMSYWHGVDFSKMAETERDATLRAATQWVLKRHEKHARVDREAHGRLCGVLRAVLAEELGPPPGTRVAVLRDDDVVYEGVVEEILRLARSRIRFDNGDSWDATFPDATVTVISPASRDAPASAATPAAVVGSVEARAIAAALALGRPDVGAVLAREAAAKPAKPAKKRKADAKPAKSAAESEAEKEKRVAAREAGKKEAELDAALVPLRELAIAEARLSERRGVLAAEDEGEAATLARNFVGNDALQAALSGEAFLDAVLSRSGLALSAEARATMAAARGGQCFFKPKGAT